MTKHERIREIIKKHQQKKKSKGRPSSRPEHTSARMEATDPKEAEAAARIAFLEGFYRHHGTPFQGTSLMSTSVSYAH